MYTIIPFRYVDASHFKQYEEIVLDGGWDLPAATVRLGLVTR